jgi:arylformamidase
MVEAQMPAPSALDLQFNPRLAVADADAIIAARARASSVVASTVPVRREAYGAGAREYYLLGGTPAAEAASAVVIFIHGGYWRSGAAEDNLVLAPAIAALGARPVFLGYPLCPDTPLREVSQAVRRGVEALLARTGDHRLDPGRVVLAGTSAGAHLAARLAAEPAMAGRIHGALLLTGIYDLTPVPLLGVNVEIGLDVADVHALSPLVHAYPSIPTVFAIGGLEPPMWRAQTFAMAAVTRAGGAPTAVIDVPGRNHFDLLLELTLPQSGLSHALARLLGAVATQSEGRPR